MEGEFVDTICMKVKLKAESLPRVRAWFEEINRRMPEVAETLRDEGVVVESVFLDSSDAGDFLIQYIKVKDFARAQEVAANSTHPIDVENAALVQEHAESVQVLELLTDMDPDA